MNELYVVPLGQGRFSTIAVRDGTVTLEQVRNLVGADGIGLQLVPVPNADPGFVEAAPVQSTTEQENNGGS